MRDWREGLTHKDWLFDGHPIRSEHAIDRFNRLDWLKAWVDIGPSIAGYLGPYWHVPMDDGDTMHRLYPKVLGFLTKDAARKWSTRREAALDQPNGIEEARSPNPVFGEDPRKLGSSFIFSTN